MHDPKIAPPWKEKHRYICHISRVLHLWARCLLLHFMKIFHNFPGGGFLEEASLNIIANLPTKICFIFVSMLVVSDQVEWKGDRVLWRVR